MAIEITAGQLAEIVGAPRRSIIHWAERGVIESVAGSEGLGSGKHRRFGRQEVEIASVISRLAKYQLPFGVLSEVAGWLRDIERTGESEAAGDLKSAALIVTEEAIKRVPLDRRKVYTKEELTKLGLRRLPEGGPTLSNRVFQRLQAYVTYSEARMGVPVVLIFARYENNWVAELKNAASLGNETTNESEYYYIPMSWLPSETCIVINLTEIFARLW